VLTNVGGLYVGAGVAGSAFNQIILTNGGQLFRSGATISRIGGDSSAASRSNTVIIVGGTVASTWNNGGFATQRGRWPERPDDRGYNRLILDGNGSAAILNNVSILNVGNMKVATAWC